MAASAPVQPQFPGGWEPAPEITGAGGCGHSACSCLAEPGKAFCCRACARAGEESADCGCGHAGCTSRRW